MQPITVGQITRHIKGLLDESTELQDIWVTGEVSNFSRASSGHCYFTLQDSDATLRCVMWRTTANRMTSLPRTGDMVDVFGYVSVYERGGSYQFYASDVRSSGVGQLWQAFLETKERLEREGLFDEGRKRPIPEWPRRIGVVTSPTGAAFQDILNVLVGRYPLVDVVLSPSLVQGSQAPTQLVAALRRLYRLPDLDVILIARGGGSMEDLWSFNDEGLARTIVESPVPVISGVGHETDFTITDFCADLRTPTPSTAAAAAVPDGEALRVDILERVQTCTSLIEDTLARLQEKVAQAERTLDRYDPMRGIAERRQRIDDLMNRARMVWQAQLGLRRAELEAQVARLAALSPHGVLARGYAIIQDQATGARIVRADQTTPDQDIRVHLSDSAITARVTGV